MSFFMKYKISSLLLFLLIGIYVQAEIPNTAKVSMHTQAGDESALSIVNLKCIQLVLNDQNRVQSVFVFEDQSTVVFDNVEAIELEYENQSVNVDYNPATDVESIAGVTLGVSPNPTSDVVYISGMKENSRGAVFNLSGQRICDFGGHQTTLNVSTWAVGTYIIRIDNEYFKLIKQ